MATASFCSPNPSMGLEKPSLGFAGTAGKRQVPQKEGMYEGLLGAPPVLCDRSDGFLSLLVHVMSWQGADHLGAPTEPRS